MKKIKKFKTFCKILIFKKYEKIIKVKIQINFINILISLKNNRIKLNYFKLH